MITPSILYFHSANALGASLAMMSAHAPSAVKMTVPVAPIFYNERQRAVGPAKSDALHELTLKPLIRSVEDFAKLRAGWDGAGSVAPTFKTIAATLIFLRSLSPLVAPPEITPAGDGEISLSWRQADKYVDVSFDNGSASAYVRIAGKTAKLREIDYFHELPAFALDALIDS